MVKISIGGVNLVFKGKKFVVASPPYLKLKESSLNVSAKQIINDLEITLAKPIFKNARTAAILIPDKTRPTIDRRLFSSLFKLLAKKGVKKISLVIAYGTHKEHPSALLGLHRELLSRATVVHHDCHNKKAMCIISTSRTISRKKFLHYLKTLIQSYRKRKNFFMSLEEIRSLKREFQELSTKPIYINRDFFDADIKLVFSDIKPHQMYGYSGGSKMILPGIADFNTISSNHIMRMHPSSKVGNYTGNILRQESEEIASMIKNVIYIHSVSVPNLGTYSASVSIGVNSWKKMAKIASSLFQTRQRKYQTVISLGRPPIDIDTYQLTKATTPAALTVKKGGNIIMVANIREGLGNLNAIRERIYKLTIKKELPSGKEKIYLLSNLKADDVRKTYMSPIDRKQFAKLLKEAKGKILVIPDGDLLVPA
jgi:nickel-dependent lactate racemase